MRRFPHSIDKDILAVYQRPSWLPPSDDEYGEDSEESEEVEEEVGEEGEEEDGSEVVEEEEEEEECLEEEEDTTTCFEEKDEMVCVTRKKEYKETEVSGKLAKKGGEKSQGKQKQSKSKEDQKSASGDALERDKMDMKIIRKKKNLSDEESDEEAEYMAALREKRLGDSEEDEEVEEEEYLWEVDEKVRAGKRLTLKPREYDPYDEDSDEMIDAEDDEWMEGLIPTLADLAIRNMARNFEIYQGTNILFCYHLLD